MADQIDISQYEWETSQDGDKVIAIPIATLQTRVQHTYETLNIAPGLTIEGRNLELAFQVWHETKGWIDAVPNYKWHADLRNKYVIRLKTQAVEDKKEEVASAAVRRFKERLGSEKDGAYFLGFKDGADYAVEILNIETIVQQTLKYIAERGTVCHGTRIIDCEELLSIQPEIIKVIKEKVK